VRVLLYAINGVGLGHVARLSVLADRLRELEPAVEISFYSNSPFARQLLGADGDTVILPEDLAPTDRATMAYEGFEAALDTYRPDVVVCDTHWPTPIVGDLRRAGVRTVLVLRLVALERAEGLLRLAHRDFDRIIVPHWPDEIVSLYGADPLLLDALEHPSVFVAGPLARRAVTGRAAPLDVLFSLGGGGEYLRVAEQNRVGTLLGSFRRAAALLSSQGVRCHLARGPFLSVPPGEDDGWTVLETLDLPPRLGGGTLLVGRAGYNTCWETLAAGARLVLVGSHAGFEDVDARTGYLVERRLAVSAATDPDSIAAAVLGERARGWDAEAIRARAAVNLGLDACVRRIVHD
jgi:hypothetical protein